MAEHVICKFANQGARMNRREMFLFGAAAAVSAMSVGTRTDATAQTPEATPDNVFRFPLDDRVVSAARNFVSDPVRMFAPLRYAFGVDLFDDERAAEVAFERFDEFTGAYLAATSDSVDGDMTVGERRKLSAPKLGDRRTADAIDATISGTDVTFAILFAQKGTMLHRWMGLGLSNPARELFRLAEEHMKFEEVDPNNDEELFSLLPDLNDLPAGYVVSDSGGERIERYDDYATPSDRQAQTPDA
jgi:hypothetical protein